MIWTNAGIVFNGHFKTNFSEDWHFTEENAFENVVWKMEAILYRPQCVNRYHCYHEINTILIACIFALLYLPSMKDLYQILTTIATTLEERLDEHPFSASIPMEEHLIKYLAPLLTLCVNKVDKGTFCNWYVLKSDTDSFRITDPLWRESIGHRWIPLTKGRLWWASILSSMLSWINCWINNRIAGE